MGDRQQRLEEKVQHLQRATIWSRRLGKFGLLFAGLGLVYMVGEFSSVMSSEAGLTYASTDPLVEGFTEVVVWVFVAWWAHRIADAFSAIVDVIGELSETV